LIYIDDTKGGGDIFEYSQKGEFWSKPERYNSKINTIFHETSASLSSDGRTLYFTSNKLEDNFGRHDIYKSTVDKNGKWGAAQNLGAVVNTPYDEESVFFHPDGKTLYFSSEGHKTMGSYDIFKSVFKNGKWSEPINLGYPINTAYQDVGFVLSASGKHGYYSSFRDSGFGEKDFSGLRFLELEKPVVINNENLQLLNSNETGKETIIEPVVEVGNSLTLLKGLIIDELTQKFVEATIELVDNEKKEVIASFNSNSKTGKYLVSLPSGKNYGIAVKAEDYLFHSENFDIPSSSSYQEITKNIALKSISIGSKIVLKNIFFDFDKATIRTESSIELGNLIKLLSSVPSLRIEISGHTDNKGSSTYNLTLSESRAKAVVDYLETNGVNKSRLEYKGYGLTQPIATNDTEEGRQMNRRTEFKVLSK
jgi:outer membrane protein OmpA-like peptidoglycan-associated protein